MHSGVRPAGHEPDGHLAALGDQFLGGHRDVTERGELLGEAVEGRAWFVGLAMDDLVVVDDARGDVIGQVADPVLVHGLEQAADGLLVCPGSGHVFPGSGHDDSLRLILTM